MDSFISTLWTGPFPAEGCLITFLLLVTTMFYRYSYVNNADSIHPDQTLQYAASDLGLHYLPMSLLWDARHIWVIIIIILSNLNPKLI